MTPHEYASKAMEAHDEWLEDVLAGILVAGAQKTDIEVQRHPDNRTVVCIKGVPKYEWQLRVHGQ